MKTTSEMLVKALEILAESDMCPGDHELKEAGYVPAGEDGCGPCVGDCEDCWRDALENSSYE
jgi:hypothetical protein